MNSYIQMPVAKILKKFIVLLIVFAVFAGTLFVESGIEKETVVKVAKLVSLVPSESVTLQREGEVQDLTSEKKLKVGDKISTDSTQIANINFNSYGVIRIAPSSTVIFRDEFDDGYFFELEKGKLWVNNMYTSSYLNVLAGGALMMPKRSVFDVAFDGVVTQVRSFSNHVNVGLVDLGFKTEKILHFKDDTLINSFLVAQGGKSSVYLSKVANNAEILKKLLYSKLIKEFQYSLMGEDVLITDKWVITNQGHDDVLLSSVEDNKSNKINSRGLKFASLDSLGYQVNQGLNNAADVLTFSGERRFERLMNNIFNHMLDAEYLYSFGRFSEAKERLNLFSVNIKSEFDKVSPEFKVMVMDKLRWYYSDLNYVLPNDDLYLVKVEISDLLLQMLGNSDEDVVEKLQLIRDYLNYAYAIAETGELKAKLALDQYYGKIGDFIQRHKANLQNVKFLISEDNQIMDNLLRQYAEFYKDSIFAMKNFLENKWLDLLPDGTEKIEEQQTIIVTKIDFLKRLEKFFLEQEVTLADARKIVLRLINEIQDYETSAEVGVSQLFALRLKDYGNFLRFLNSVDVSTLRGVSPRTKYKDFLAKQKEQVSIEQAISEFFGEEPSVTFGVTTQQVLDQIGIDFELIGVTTLQLGSFRNLDQKYIEVRKGIMDDVEFSARYDWDQKQISQIRVGSKVISQNPIRLTNLTLLLKPKVEKKEPSYILPPENGEEKFGEPQESKADKVAKILLLKKLQTYDVTVAEANIIISDADKQLYVVNGAVLLSNPNVQIAFIFDNRQEVASSLAVRTPSGDKKLEGSYVLTEISRVVQDIYERSFETTTEEVVQ